MSTEPSSSATILDVNACWRLLRATEVGRLAVCVADRPEIFPINYVVDHGTIVFRTGEGTKFAATVLRPSAAFEIDGYEAEIGEAWSVVTKGRVEEIKMYELLDSTELPLFPWHAGSKQRFMRIIPEEISGRRFHVLDRETWRTRLTDAPRSAPE